MPRFGNGATTTLLVVTAVSVEECSVLVRPAHNVLNRRQQSLSVIMAELDPDGAAKTGRVKWFNVAKGFGFITPHDDSPDVFVHQSVIQMSGFRSLGDNEEVEFVSQCSEQGLEAVSVCGPGGADCKGSHRRPIGKSRITRCYNCGAINSHRASSCPEGTLPKSCYLCRASNHLVAECPLNPKRGSPPDTAS